MPMISWRSIPLATSLLEIKVRILSGRFSFCRMSGSGALDLRGSLQELLDARVELGLTSADAPPVAGGIRAAVGFGDDARSAEVRRRYAMVLGIANARLPPGVGAIETWVLANGRSPVRID